MGSGELSRDVGLLISSMKYARLLIFLTIAVSAKSQTFDGASIAGTNFTAQTMFDDGAGHTSSGNWLLYGVGTLSSQDQPEGGWYYSPSIATNDSFTVLLPSTLAAGIWRFQLKTINYDNAVGDFRNSTVQFVLGGATSSPPAAISDRDNSRWLQQGVNVTSIYATNKMTMLFQNISNYPMQMFLSALYWTTNLNEDVDGDENNLIVNYSYPTDVSAAVDNTNNLLAYSSFEAGISPWRVSVAVRLGTITNWITYSDAQHGSAALRFAQASSTVTSPYFWVKPDHRNYTVSCYWKGSGTIAVNTPLVPPTGFSNTVSSTLTLPSVGSWTRTNFSVNLKDYPRGVPYQISLVGASNTLFDAVMVNEGTNVATYRLMDGIEIGWSNSVLSAVYYSNAVATPYIVVHNSSGSNRTVRVNYDFWNYWNRRETNGQFDTTLADGAKSVTAVALPSAVGWYRARAWGDNIPPQETTLIKMVDPGTSQNDFIGTHNSGQGDNWQYAGMERLGISHTRAMSPDGIFRWTLAEPTEGAFVWYDSYVSNAAAMNIKVLGTLGDHTGSSIPAYAGGSYAAIDLTKWSNHVFAMVTHYKSWVTNWEIFNEAWQGGCTVGAYTNILKTASLAARAADTNAYIVGLGGAANLAWIQGVLDAFGSTLTNYVNALSIHGYPPATDTFSSGSALVQASGWKTGVVDAYGTPNNLPVWNTESGSKDFGGYQAFSGYPQVGAGVYLYAHNSAYNNALIKVQWHILQHTLAYKAYGFERYYYYDSRIYTDWRKIYYMTWEGGHDLHKPKVAALAVANAMVAGTTGGGRLSIANTNVVFLYFENGNNSVAAAWASNATYYTLTQTNTVPYDHFGRPITVTANQFKVGRMPVYIKPNGLTTAQFKSVLTNGGIASIADTNAPGLSIFMFPGNKIADTNRLQIRWSAVDEQSLPDVNNQSDILTRTKLSTDSDYSVWSTATERIWTNVASRLTLTVQAKDAAGNTNTESFNFGAVATTVNANILTFGSIRKVQ